MWTDFDPYMTESVGRCGTWTAGVQDPKTGANIAYSGTVCPSSIGPVWTARAQRTYKGTAPAGGEELLGQGQWLPGGQQPLRLDREPERPHPLSCSLK